MRFLYFILLRIAAAVAVVRDFPPGFKFGAASASYQVEGAWNHSDKAEGIWDRLVHARPELINGGATGDVACDSFHQWRVDADLAKELGLHFYRFSISWPRLLPNGFANKVSEDGARYYNDLIDGLLERGVEPMVTLYHWDLPQRLQDLGGWTNPEMVNWFADYARIAFNLFGDRVKTWITINEPVVICDLAYTGGVLAPSIFDSDVAPHLCARHILLAHATAYRIYQQEFKEKYGDAQISLANHAVWMEPATDTAEDVEVTELALQAHIGRYSQPIFGDGGWPDSMEKLVANNSKKEGFPWSRMPGFSKEEMELMKGTFDFFGLNHYTSRIVQAAQAQPQVRGWGWPLAEWQELPAKFGKRPEWEDSGNSWLKVYPDGLRKLLNWLKKQYGDIPIIITENGYPTSNMGLEDPERIRYYQQYLEAVLKSIHEDKVNVTGYTAWTLIDNFEWIDGYATKFGLHEVDFSNPSRKRTARDSARFYARVIEHHSIDISKPIDNKSEL